VREIRDANGVKWVVFLTARSVARDQHLPEEYREGWLVFESAHGEKRRLAPVPMDWESLGDAELASLSARATPQGPRKRAAAPSEIQHADRQSAPSTSEVLQPQLFEQEARLSIALGEVCEFPPPGKLDTGELIRVEETLEIAARAAQEAVSLRRRLRADRDRKVRDGEDSEPRPDDQHA
jgi:hypothetical protein